MRGGFGYLARRLQRRCPQRQVVSRSDSTPEREKLRLDRQPRARIRGLQAIPPPPPGYVYGLLDSSVFLILKAAQTRTKISVVADQTGSPTFTRDLARAIRDLVRQDARGIINVTNSGSCTWCEFATEVLRQAGSAAVRVQPITAAQAARSAKRPAYSVSLLAACKLMASPCAPGKKPPALTCRNFTIAENSIDHFDQAHGCCTGCLQFWSPLSFPRSYPITSAISKPGT